MAANILLATTPPPPHPGCGVIGKIHLLSKYGRVASQIKGIHKCSNMLANILPAPPLHPGDGSKGQNSTVFNFMELKGMEHRAPYKHIFSPYTHPQPVGCIKR